MSIFRAIHMLAIKPKSHWFFAFLIIASALVLPASNVLATAVPSSVLSFLERERSRSASDEQADGLYRQLTSAAFEVCFESSNYRGGAVNNRDGGEAWLSFSRWLNDGAFELNADFRNKSNALIGVLYGELANTPGAQLESNSSYEGFCSFTLRSAEEVNIPITGSRTATDPDEERDQENRTGSIQSISDICLDEFSEQSGGFIATRTNLNSFLTDLSVAEYNERVAPVSLSIITSPAPSQGCSDLAEEFEAELAALQADVCEQNPNEERCVVTPEQTSSCNVDGVGWIVCPALTFLAALTDGAFGLIEQFLVINPELLSVESGTFTFWEAMRNFANVAFIIVFLIIIFSQLSSVGISNYGVKKTLPRLIVSAILVNVSFFVCQIAVDLSNIAGSSLYSAIQSIPIESPGEDGTGNAGGWIVVIAAAILGAGAAVLAISVPVLLAALLAVAVILLILMARFALIVILTGLAPLAFVAFLLPNTEHLFKKWLKLFTSMLVLYPIIAVVFGASYLASRIIANAGGTIDQPLLQVTALGVAALPLLVVPSILKSSLNAAGSIGSRLSSMSSKANSRIGSKVKTSSRLGEAQRAVGQRMVQRRAIRRSNSKVANYVDQSRLGKALGFDKGAAVAGEVANKAEAESVAAVEGQIRQRSVSNPKHAQEVLKKALVSGDTVTAKAAQNALFAQGSSGVDAFHSIISTVGAGAKQSTVDGLRENITEKHGQMIKSKSVDMIKWAAIGGTLESHTEDGKTWSGLSAADLSTQTEGAMKRAAKLGHIQPATARQLLDTPQYSGSLSPEQIILLEGVAGPRQPQNNPDGPTGSGPEGLIVPGDEEFKIR